MRNVKGNGKWKEYDYTRVYGRVEAIDVYISLMVWNFVLLVITWYYINPLCGTKGLVGTGQYHHLRSRHLLFPLATFPLKRNSAVWTDSLAHVIQQLAAGTGG